MKRKMEVSELIFKIIAYILLIIFSALCIYPLLYALGSMFSGFDAVRDGKVILWPVDVQGKSFMYVATNSRFWINYSNTLFVTFIGSIWCLIYSVLGAYALSKKRLMGRHGFNFFLVFTMWFAAGVVPTYLNYQQTGEILASIAGKDSMYDIDLKWLIVLAMGMNATNIVLLRNAFEGVPSEIEEAARIDGATELQILTKVYIPMSKATIATVALFFGISRWNGYFWAYRMLGTAQDYSWPVQVYMRDFMQLNTELTKPRGDDVEVQHLGEATSYLYSMVIFAMIPILIIYPFIQKYFAKGVNMGGVKE